MNAAILGFGTAVPEHAMSQADAAELARVVICRDAQQERLASVLYRRAGVEQRRTVVPHRLAMNWVDDEPEGAAAVAAVSTGPTTGERMRLYQQHAGPLARRAAEGALERSGLVAAEVTHLVTISCTGFYAPGLDVGLIHELSLAPTVQRVQVGFMGCHGAINGLRVAHGLAAADPAARILMCAVELCSLHYHFRWDPERLVANALFGDGAAAVVVSKQEPPSDGWSICRTGSCLLPDSAADMTWRIGDYGFEMTLSARVPDLILEHLRPWLTAWLDEYGIPLEAVAAWAIHPGGPRILGAVEQGLGLDRTASATSRDVLAEYGNMSSPTVLFILDRLRQQGKRGPCVAVGFGPGMVAEAALLV